MFNQMEYSVMTRESNQKWRRRSREAFARFAASSLGVEPFCAREAISESSFRR